MPAALDRATDALLHLSRALVAVAARSLAEVEDSVTLQQYRALSVLWDNPDLVTRDLAIELNIHPSTATRLCDRLVGKGLMERNVSEKDRREYTLALTPEGRALVEQVLSRRRAELRAIVRAMPADSWAAAERGLRAFNEAAARRKSDDGQPVRAAGWW